MKKRARSAGPRRAAMDLVTTSPMPITLSILDVAYERRVAQGTLCDLVDGHACARCGGPLTLTNRRRRRGRVRAEGGRCVAKAFVALLAKCRCGHMPRVLPANLLPGKVYTVEAQEAACRGYLAGPGGLRLAARRLGAAGPHFTTLHGWLGGLGAYALGLETPAGAAPAAVLLEETRRRHLPDLQTRWEAPVQVAPQRYRSEDRRELLEATTRFLGLAAAVVATLATAPDSDSRLAEWVRLATGWPVVTTISWSARKRGTAIQPPPPRSGVGFRQNAAKKPEPLPCQTPCRSPPSDSG